MGLRVDEPMQQVEALLAAHGGALDWDRLTNLATKGGVKLPALRKLKRLPGCPGEGETRKPVTPGTNEYPPGALPSPGGV